MKEIYKDHALCVRKDCELASTCARAIAFREVTDDDRRNGKLLLPPEEQEYIRKVFAQYAYADEVFDGYEDKEVFVLSSR